MARTKLNPNTLMTEAYDALGLGTTYPRSSTQRLVLAQEAAAKASLASAELLQELLKAQKPATTPKAATRTRASSKAPAINDQDLAVTLGPMH